MVINKCPGEISQKIQRRRKFLLIEDLLEDLSFSSCCRTGLKDSRVILWLDSIHPPMELVMTEHYPFSQQVFPCFVVSELRLLEQVPGTIPRWLRKYEAD